MLALNVTSVYKKGNKRDPLNYSPISLTSCFCKLMESCVKEVMWKFWLERNLICQSQHGFTPNPSCTSQLLSYLDDVSNHVDNGLVVDAFYLDFAKAFTSVLPERLLRKLSALGIKGKFYQWIWSFLLHRKEIVSVNNKMSKPKNMISGVPQGSCLGPLLFLAYVDNDFDDCLAHSSVLKHADDNKMYIDFSLHS